MGMCEDAEPAVAFLRTWPLPRAVDGRRQQSRRQICPRAASNDSLCTAFSPKPTFVENLSGVFHGSVIMGSFRDHLVLCKLAC